MVKIFMSNCKDIHSRYVLRAMEGHCLNGDAYVAEDVLYHRCKERQRGLAYATSKADLAEQIRLGYIHPEGSHLYINRTWRYEEDASKQLVTILRQPTLPAMAVPENLSVNGIALCQEQRVAVELALTNKLSLILGGAGCGKSTLIRAIVNMVGGGTLWCCARLPVRRPAISKSELACRPAQFTVPSECTRTRTFWLL